LRTRRVSEGPLGVSLRERGEARSGTPTRGPDGRRRVGSILAGTQVGTALEHGQAPAFHQGPQPSPAERGVGSGSMTRRDCSRERSTASRALRLGGNQSLVGKLAFAERLPGAHFRHNAILRVPKKRRRRRPPAEKLHGNDSPIGRRSRAVLHFIQRAEQSHRCHFLSLWLALPDDPHHVLAHEG
jgi:hypothetical protein